MLRIFVRSMLFLLAVLSPSATAAEPIKLKLSYYTSDREMIYRTAVKPFVDNVNTAANGLIEIEVFTSGALGKSYPGQMQLVLDGVADFAFINPALTPERFPDDAAIEMPGVFRSVQEASIVYTRLLARGALRGYEDFFVVGAFGAGPQTIHMRAPIASLNDLQGKPIRVSNRTVGAILTGLGMFGQVIPINQTAEAISRGTVDGATVPFAVLVDFGIGRVASYHYRLGLGSAPLLVLMNRQKFDSLPKAGQDIIRKFSGEWLATRFSETFDASNELVKEQLQSDPKRRVMTPTQPDLDTAQAIFKTVIQEWQAKDPHNRELFARIEAELTALRGGR